MTSKNRDEPMPFVGVPEAAKHLGLSVRSTQNLIASKIIAAYKPNGGVTSAYLIAREEIERFERDEAELLVARKAAARVAEKSARARKAAHNG